VIPGVPLLVVVLGPEEGSVGRDLGVQLPVDQELLEEGRLGLEPLRLVVVEDRGAVLSAGRRGGRVVARPEDREQLAVGYVRGIEVDLDRLGVVP
jgi:hypothetical protein